MTTRDPDKFTWGDYGKTVALLGAAFALMMLLFWLVGDWWALAIIGTVGFLIPFIVAWRRWI